MTPPLFEDLINAVNGVALRIQPDTWDEMGGMFTCSEANALIDLFEALGLHDIAEGLLNAHGASDEEETDEHHDTYLWLQEKA